jgi:hypothetical protein
VAAARTVIGCFSGSRGHGSWMPACHMSNGFSFSPGFQSSRDYHLLIFILALLAASNTTPTARSAPHFSFVGMDVDMEDEDIPRLGLDIAGETDGCR